MHPLADPATGRMVHCMSILETERLVLRELTPADAPFILELLNEPAYHRYIGDKGVRDLAGAEKYLREGPMASYARNGFGLWLVSLKDGTPIGMCGPIRRDTLEHPDLGFALLARFAGQGYAHEAASAVLAHARSVLKLGAILAITAPENPPSIKLLGKLGFRFERMIALPGYAEPSRLFIQTP
jgi:[ribosomal protein S5]-alanine N-acetyltransferase